MSDYDIFSIKLENGEWIESTPSHPFYSNRQWVYARELTIGDRLSLDIGELEVVEIKVDSRLIEVFNLTVDDSHTYFVGKDGVLVHNANKDDECLQKISKIPGRVRSRVNLKGCGRRVNGVCKNGWEHVLEKHISGNQAGGSIFATSPEELRYILQSPIVVGALVKPSGNSFVRIVKMPNYIGWDVKNGSKLTKWMTIRTDKFGNLLTAYPGK